MKKSKADEDESDESALVQEELSKIVLNPNVFTDFKVAGSAEVGIESDTTSIFLVLFFFCATFLNYAGSEAGSVSVLGCTVISGLFFVCGSGLPR